MRDKGTPNHFRATDDAVRPGVVLLHGIGRTSRSLRRLEKALQEAGFATLNLDYQSRKKPLDALAGDIHPVIIDFAEANKGPLHFVAHSMGGLLTRVYVAKYRPARLAHVVMIPKWWQRNRRRPERARPLSRILWPVRPAAIDPAG